MTIREAQFQVDQWISTYGEQSPGTDLEKAFRDNPQKKTSRDFARHQQNDKLKHRSSGS